MCGIAGLAGPIVRDPSAPALLSTMTGAMVHRGPDGEGHWFAASAPVALGQRRLAIIDLSPGGYQPRLALGGECAITYNGELYNYRELRAELMAAGCTFESTSDTEVFMVGILHWGVVPMLERANGMFAFAFWDGRDGSLWLARDRFGEKPLYWSSFGGSVAFASELKALRPVPGFDRTIDRDALGTYFRYAAVQAPQTIYRGTQNVEPGCVVRITIDRDRAGQASVVRYWDPVATALEARDHRFAGSYDDAVDALDEVLGQSVSMRMVADVPLGAFLSGGIDSSTIVSLMRRSSTASVKTFTIGFAEERYNEAADALAVARHLGVEHTEFTVTSAEALAVVPRLADMYDEPFADSSQIPTHVVSALARDHVTVALSGDAGDELFGGYNRYVLAESVWNRVGWMPAAVRRTLARGVHAVPPSRLDGLARPLARVPQLSALRSGSPGDRIHKAAGLLAQRDRDDLYRSLISCWSQPIVPGAHVRSQRLPSRGSVAFAEQMMLCDTVGYLPNDILTKVDRAAMATSLETRVPILDPDVYKFAWSLPLEWRVAGSTGKVIMRDLLARYVPRPLFERPKTGFGIPLEAWLRGPLQSWADDLLHPDRLAAQGLVDVDLVTRTWAEHRSGRRNWQHMLWAVLMFQLWYDRWASDTPVPLDGRPAGATTSVEP